MSIWNRTGFSFGFVSTRFAGTNGVSLEAGKWAEVLQDKGCPVFYMAGKLDTDPDVSHLAPKAFFLHEEILEVQHALFVEKRRTPHISRQVHAFKEELKDEIEQFQRRFGFDILAVHNALAIPLNIPLGLALAEFIVESGIPTIAHHYDFFWERLRFQSFAAVEYLSQAFPPIQPNIQHVVINSLAGEALGRRTGVSWLLLPNVMDFKVSPPGLDEYNRDFRREIGLDNDLLLILQPTRVVPRKGIEAAIELVRRLEDPKSCLVITHEAGDEGLIYRKRVEEYARLMGVDLRFISDRIAKNRGMDREGRKLYALWDVYPHADLVTYPSTYEGYGNAFVEAIYFRKPVVVNRYPVFVADIEPRGFDVITFDTFITEETVNEVRRLIRDPERRARMTETNYELGRRYLSYEVLEEKLEALLTKCEPRPTVAQRKPLEDPRPSTWQPNYRYRQ
jgi:glycosyltransferase involved in cell wall biosynthesis